MIGADPHALNRVKHERILV